MGTLEIKLARLENRIEKLEKQVFGSRNAITQTSLRTQGAHVQLEDLKIPSNVLSALQVQVRRIGYMNLILILLYFSPHSLTYSQMMNISKELKKPVSYEWLNTEFHRKKHSGLVRSEPIPGSKEKTYTLNEPGRKRTETVLAKLKTPAE